jgi:EAL domain-containing protein (putative c-di-GMP-specific phosphodiesterase class I)
VSSFISDNTPTTVDGVRAVEIRYRAIRTTDTGTLKFFQTQMRLNSPSMGVLMPDRYLPVLDCTDQCIEVFRLAFIQILQAVGKFTDKDIGFDWVSVYMPIRLLRRPDCLRTVSQLSDKYKIPPDKICFEISVALLDETDSRCADSIRQLRKSGYHTMLTEVGGDSCPMMKLAPYNLDYILLDGVVTQLVGKGEKADICVKSMINFVNEFGAEPIATEVEDDSLCDTLYDFECSFYTGEAAGNFVTERYIRKKSDNSAD